MNTARHRQRTTAKDRADLRNRLLDRATQLVVEEGKDFSLRQLAAEAETSTTSIYTLFGGREGLELALFERSFELFGALVAACDATLPPREHLLAICDAYRRFATEHPEAYRLVFAGQTRFEPIEASPEESFQGLPSPTSNGHKVYAAFVEAMRRCQDAGELDGSVEPYVLVDLIWCQMHGFVMLEQAGYSRSPEDSERRFRLGVPAIFNGMRDLSRSG